MNAEHGSNEHQDDYSFMQETIKDEQISPKRVISKAGKWMGLGIAFGIGACVAFFALKPWAEETFQKEPEKVEIQQKDPENVEELQKENEEVQAVEKEELTIEDHYALNEELRKVTQEAQKSVVKVSGYTEGNDWTTGMSSLDGTAGLIVADNGRELLVLSKYSMLKGMHIFYVEFANGSTHAATLKQKDLTLDMAVFSVAKDEVDEKTWESIKIAQFGNSARLAQGRTLIAVGEPFGFENGIGYGIASSVTEKVTLADAEYNVIATDMTLTADGNGFLFDVYGNVMGFVDVGLAKKLNAGTMVAYGISSITTEIEMMSNGKYVPYTGIIGTMVTEETSELYNIPKGLYVTDVEKNSPAMNAGIQNGDIITKVGNVDVSSLDSYQNALYKLQVGNLIKFEGKRYGTEEYVDIDFTVTIGIKE